MKSADSVTRIVEEFVCPCCGKQLDDAGECPVCDRDPLDCPRCVQSAEAMADGRADFRRVILRSDRFRYQYDANLFEGSAA